jgi:hypothetical protein
MKIKLISLIILVLTSNISISQWSTDPSENLKVLYYSLVPCLVTDGDGGAIIVGETYTVFPQLRAQRVDKYGNILWDASLNGILVSTAGDERKNHIVVPDGAGGVYIGFEEWTIVGREEEPPGNIYFSRVRVQRINANGNLLFGSEGLPVYHYPVDISGGGQCVRSMVSDNSGGVFVLWGDRWGSQGNDKYINYITPDGHISWENSIALNAPSSLVERDFLMYSDGEDGIIVYLLINSTASIPDKDRFIRINRQGEIIHNKQIDTGLTGFYLSAAVNGECILFWQDFNQTGNTDTIRCQKINRDGLKLWGATPTIVDCTGIVRNYLHEGITSDSLGGAYVAYGKGDRKSRLIHVDSNREIIFKKDVINFNGVHNSGQSCMVGYADKVIYSLFMEYGLFSPDSAFAYAFDSFGKKIWPGVIYSTRNRQAMSDAVISDGNGGAIFAWHENLPQRGTWIQQVNKNGQLGIVTAVEKNRYKSNKPNTFQLHATYPNPGKDTIIIPYRLAKNNNITIKIYNLLGKEVRTFGQQYQHKGFHQVTWDSRDNNGYAVTNGIYFYQITTMRRQQVRKFIIIC